MVLLLLEQIVVDELLIVSLELWELCMSVAVVVAAAAAAAEDGHEFVDAEHNYQVVVSAVASVAAPAAVVVVATVAVHETSTDVFAVDDYG